MSPTAIARFPISQTMLGQFKYTTCVYKINLGMWTHLVHSNGICHIVQIEQETTVVKEDVGVDNVV